MTEIICDIRFGSVRIEPDPKSPIHSFRVEADDRGTVTRTRFVSHYVCFGVDRCIVCGTPMGEPEKKWWHRIAAKKARLF